MEQTHLDPTDVQPNMALNRVLNQDETTHLAAWRTDALTQMPYMSSMLFSLRAVSSNWVDSVAVDKYHRLYVNFETMIQHGPRFAAEALLHACSHMLAQHAMLAEATGVNKEERRDWNVAADAAINDDLRDAGCATIREFGIMPADLGMPDYKDPTEYMSHLRRVRSQRPADEFCAQCGGDEFDPEIPLGSECAWCGEELTPFSGCGSGSGGVSGYFELDIEDDMDGTAPAATDLEMLGIRIRTVVAIEEHMRTKGHGSVPGGYTELIKIIMKPTGTPWERLLRSTVRRALNRRAGAFDVDPARVNRRRFNDQLVDAATGASLGRIIVPGTYENVPRVFFVRDTSGSMSAKELQAVSNEVINLSQKMGVRGEDLLLLDLDTEVADVRHYKTFADLAEVHGRGGTDMCEAIQWAERNRESPTVMVIATDGGTPWPSEKPKFPVVVALTGNGNPDLVPSWAKVIIVDNVS